MPVCGRPGTRGQTAPIETRTMHHLLVTGATGSLGGRVVRAACPHFEVHTAGRAPLAPLPPGVRFHSCDPLAPVGSSKPAHAPRLPRLGDHARRRVGLPR
jgi:hypothetical protein